MDLQFRLASPDCRIDSSALREQIQSPPPRRGASLYLIYLQGEEVAFVSIDHLPGTTELLIYEILLDPAYRGRGIGTAIMREIEAFAVRRGYERILLCPQPLDPNITIEALTRWYARLGFRRSSRSRDVMEKELSPSKRES